MRKTLIGLIALALVAACVRPPVLPNNNNNNHNHNGNQTENPSEKLSGITYQLLIYSFADSDGDGVGDFKGIQNKLDYLDAIGATALWLSPAHPTSSYHAYDVNDYYSLNPLYAVGEKTTAKAEADFKELLAAA
ncbi:MAG: hypothetical protein J6W94_04810, partial [Bacteroidales bacterium]|nr:hypothetical protein [Bacteroidales bacterium]